MNTIKVKLPKVKLNGKNYINRDVSWMYFNHRILKEAEKKTIPLYERLNFLGIYSNNLDEFYKVRVASFKRIAENDLKDFSSERKQAKENLKIITKLTREYGEEFETCRDEIFSALAKVGILLIDEQHLNAKQQEWIKDFFLRKALGYINPIILSKKANVDSVNDSHIYLAVKMTAEDKKAEYALVPLPVTFTGRFVDLGQEDGKNYIMYIDDIVRYNLPLIFNGLGYKNFEAYAFKFTKDAEMEVESDPEEGLLKSISEAVKERKRGSPVRVLFGEGMPKDLRKVLMKRLDIDTDDLISIGGRYHNNRDLMSFPRVKNSSQLSYPDWKQTEIIEMKQQKSLLETIRKHDLFIHVPYESFDAFIRVLQEAAISSDVTEIKATIYRAAKNSQVVRALSSASQNGKKVTAVVELMARFDESSNISISQKLKEDGCNVLTGEEGFKIHGKIVYIKTKSNEDIAIISTGNFHEGNAKLYTDCLLFTTDKKIVKDVANLFEYIAQPFRRINFPTLLVSPNHMQSVFKRLIKNEIKNHLLGLPSGIKIKINHITDVEMVKLLYEASSSGVDTKLLVRGNCSLVGGLPDLSEHMQIHSLIDRYLEHSRIFIFSNGGEELCFMGSADWMPRNLYNRIEVVTPVYDPDVKKELNLIFDYGFKDNTKSSFVNINGDYIPVAKTNNRSFRSQEELFKYYQKKNS